MKMSEMLPDIAICKCVYLKRDFGHQKAVYIAVEQLALEIHVDFLFDRYEEWVLTGICFAVNVGNMYVMYSS